jgi:hypothetical protein
MYNPLLPSMVYCNTENVTLNIAQIQENNVYYGTVYPRIFSEQHSRNHNGPVGVLYMRSNLFAASGYLGGGWGGGRGLMA